MPLKNDYNNVKSLQNDIEYICDRKSLVIKNNEESLVFCKKLKIHDNINYSHGNSHETQSIKIQNNDDADVIVKQQQQQHWKAEKGLPISINIQQSSRFIHPNKMNLAEIIKHGSI